MTWELKPGAAPDNAHYQGNTNVNGEDMTEIERICYSQFLARAAHSLACSTRQRKPVTHVSRDLTPGITIAPGEELQLLLPWLFPTKPTCSTHGNSRTPQTGL